MGSSLLDSLNTVSTVLVVLGVLLLIGAVIGSIPLTTVVPVPGRRERFAIGAIGSLLIVTALISSALEDAAGDGSTATPAQVSQLVSDAAPPGGDTASAPATPSPTNTSQPSPDAPATDTPTATPGPPTQAPEEPSATPTDAPADEPPEEPSATPTATLVPPADLSVMLPALSDELADYHVEATKAWDANSLAAQRPDPKAFLERLELWGFRQGASLDFLINDDVTDYSGRLVQVSVGVSEFHDADGALASARYTYEQEMTWIFEQAQFVIDGADTTEFEGGPGFQVTGYGAINPAARVAYVLVVRDNFLYTISGVGLDLPDIVAAVIDWTNRAAWN